MRVLLLSPLPPPSGGIARWTERYLEWCNGKHDVAVVNTALQGERAGEAGKQRKRSTHFTDNNHVVITLLRPDVRVSRSTYCSCGCDDYYFTSKW